MTGFSSFLALYLYTTIFSYSSVSGHLGYFLLLAIVNNSLHVILNSVGNCKLLHLQSVSHCYIAFLFLVFSKVVENVHMY